jgi:hypothetical protein
MFLPESFGARFNAPINVPNALSTEIISAVRGLKEIIDLNLIPNT